MTETRRQERAAEGLAKAVILRKPQFVAWVEPRNKTYSASFRRPGDHTFKQWPAIGDKKAQKFATTSRQQQRAEAIDIAFADITKRYGGEPRKIRRQLARDIAAGRTKAVK